MSDNFKGLSTAACVKHLSADTLSWIGAGHWVIDQLHPGGRRCPHCQTEVTDDRRLERWYQCERIQCKSCRGFFTSLSGTILQRSQLDPRAVYLLAVLSELEVPAAKIAQVIDVHKDTVRNWQMKLQAQSEVVGA
jgi:transposase-like protein